MKNTIFQENRNKNQSVTKHKFQIKNLDSPHSPYSLWGYVTFGWLMIFTSQIFTFPPTNEEEMVHLIM